MDEYLSISEAAKVKGCTRQTIYTQVDKGNIDETTIAGRRVIVDNEKFRTLVIARGNWQKIDELERIIKSHEDTIKRLENRLEANEKAIAELRSRESTETTVKAAQKTGQTLTNEEVEIARKKCRTYLKIRKFSHQSFADLLEIQRPTLSKFLNNKSNSKETARKILVHLEKVAPENWIRSK